MSRRLAVAGVIRGKTSGHTKLERKMIDDVYSRAEFKDVLVMPRGPVFSVWASNGFDFTGRAIVIGWQRKPPVDEETDER